MSLDMNLLESAILNGQDLADFVEVFSYTADTARQVQPTIRLSSLSGQGGNYNIKVTINDSVLLPDRPVFVAGTITKVALTGRVLILSTNETLKILIQGNPNDINAIINVTLHDVTPSTAIDYSTTATPAIIEAIETTIPQLQIIVRPETKILAPVIPRQIRQPIHGVRS